MPYVQTILKNTFKVEKNA